MAMAGLTVHQMRICQPYGDDQRRGLWLFHLIEPGQALLQGLRQGIVGLDQFAHTIVAGVMHGARIETQVAAGVHCAVGCDIELAVHLVYATYFRVGHITFQFHSTTIVPGHMIVQ